MLRFVLHITVLTSMFFPIREMTVYQHFCHDKLIRTELFEKNTNDCCKTDEEACDGCKNEEVILSIDEFQSVAAPTIASSTSLVSVITHNTQLNFGGIHEDRFLQPSTNDPPVRSGKHRSILLQTFLL